MNNRRKLVIALGMGALAAPFSSFAQQQGKVWRVGFLSTITRPASLDSGLLSSFVQGMHELSNGKEKNLEIEWRFADGNYKHLPALAAELVQLKVDVVVAWGTPSTSAAQKATSIIPIIMVAVGDPVASGFVSSLARPESNITGVSNFTGDVSPKELDMLRSMVPKLSCVAVLVNPTNPFSTSLLKSVQPAAQSIGVKMLSVEARTAQEIESAFAAMSRGNAGAAIVQGDVFFIQQRSQIAGLAIKHRIPSISYVHEYPEAGGLMSYESNLADQFRRAVIYVDKILKGAKPADLPVEQPTKFELYINGKTAKVLGLKIPQSLLIMADKVIE